MNKPLVIAQVVDSDLCTGCGLCTYKCTSNALKMDWNEEGFLVPKLLDTCNLDGACISVCPFNPFPLDEVKDENAIAEIFLSEGTVTHEKLGKVIGIYAAYSHDFREASSSGGMATYVFDQLLDRGVVDHIFSVRPSEESGVYYQYKVSSTKEQLRDSSKTKYFPVTLATVLPEIEKLKGKVAIVGVACFVKAVRLAQHHDPKLKEKIPFIAGIICGGIKSTFFTEYLASKVDIERKKIRSPEYRIKDVNSSASDYSFGCENIISGDYKKIKMFEVGDMWGTGLFKANACDFCDDVVTELADVSLGDAWLEPYSNDGRGTSVIITRSPLAELIIQDGNKNNEINIEVITPEKMRASQQGSYNHRHEGLYVRVKEAKKMGVSIPEKRYGKETVLPDITMLHKLRRKTRKKSLEVWPLTQSALIFDKKMYKILLGLRILTRLIQLRRKLFTNIKGLFK